MRLVQKSSSRLMLVWRRPMTIECLFTVEFTAVHPSAVPDKSHHTRSIRAAHVRAVLWIS
jgi:hypothetical protein